MAASIGKTSIVEACLDAGANVNQGDMFGKTALHRAVQKEHINVVKLLLARGAESTVRCKLGKLPFDHAYTITIRDLLTVAMEKHADTLPTAAASHGGSGLSQWKKA